MEDVLQEQGFLPIMRARKGIHAVCAGRYPTAEMLLGPTTAEAPPHSHPVCSVTDHPSWFHPYAYHFALAILGCCCCCWAHRWIRKRRKLRPTTAADDDDDDGTPPVPSYLVCPVSLDLMTDPVRLDTTCGHSLDRTSAEAMFRGDGDGCESRHRCPECRAPIRSTALIPNLGLRCTAEGYLSAAVVCGGVDGGGDGDGDGDDAPACPSEDDAGGRSGIDDDDSSSSSSASALTGPGPGAVAGIRATLVSPHGRSPGFYEGDLNPRGEMHGRGTFCGDDGFVYSGELRDGSSHGRGTSSWPSGATHDGSYVGGLIQGYGIYSYPNGERYEGQWKGDKHHGTGTYFFESGVIYEGGWEEHARHGWGVFKDADGSVLERGRYENFILVEEE